MTKRSNNVKRISLISFDGQTVLKSDLLTLREQVSAGCSLVYCVVIQEKAKPDIIDRSYSGQYVWKRWADRENEKTRVRE